LVLGEEGREYVVGRAPHCDLPLSDVDVSREHSAVTRQDGAVVIRDLGAKNGTWLAGARLPAAHTAIWKASQSVRLGRTLLLLEEPLGQMLAEFESAPDEVLAEPPPPPQAAPAAPAPASVDRPPPAPRPKAPPAPRWTWADLFVMGAALAILVASLAGLAWLLRR
jgi:pSer/pThr/pTyr-binding forkhead associated (FHA) protein